MASDDETKTPKTLSDSDIKTGHQSGRRNFLGLMAVGGAAGAAAALAGGQAQAQVTDSDNGQWTDRGGCGRGSGGVYTGLTDADNGSTGTDSGGYGRGAPYC
jgi:hypothetical protein